MTERPLGRDGFIREVSRITGTSNTRVAEGKTKKGTQEIVSVPIPYLYPIPYTHCVYAKAVPGYLQWPKAVVMVSGVAGIILGIALRVPRSSRAAACGIIAFLAAVFPSNVHMALHPEIFPTAPVWLLWMRLRFQAVLIGWAYRYTF